MPKPPLLSISAALVATTRRGSRRSMPKAKKSLHSILGLTSPSRVKKPTAPQSPRASPSKRQSSSSKAGQSGDDSTGDQAGEEEPDYFEDHLDDHGLVRTLVTDLHLSDVVQAMRFVRGRMWTPMPDRRTGMGPARISEVLNYRLALPPVVTTAHLRAIMTASPSSVEREVAGLVESAIIRRVIVPGRCEALVEVQHLIEMVGKADIDDKSQKAYTRFVKGEIGSEKLERSQVDVLVKSGFLTSSASDSSGVIGGGSQPAGLLGTSRTLAHLAMAPTGSLDAVGGGAAQMVTGSGAPYSPSRSADETLRISIPNNGAFVKLLKTSLDHLVRLLEQRSAVREVPEYALREAWDGGLASVAGGKRTRGEFSGVLPGRTRKWKDYWGLRFEWVLEEAVGAGIVEVFQTGSVGRGVRAL